MLSSLTIKRWQIAHVLEIFLSAFKHEQKIMRIYSRLRDRWKNLEQNKCECHSSWDFKPRVVTLRCQQTDERSGAGVTSKQPARVGALRKPITNTRLIPSSQWLDLMNSLKIKQVCEETSESEVTELSCSRSNVTDKLLGRISRDVAFFGIE